jgi:glycosyltransferase involved in cell wall biosynthesis
VRILMITPYPPMRDGIASYAMQTVAALRADGHDVEVLSPGPSAAHHHLDLAGPRGGLAVAKRVTGYDRVVVQFHPDFFYPIGISRLRRTQISLAYAVAFARAVEVEAVVHEINYAHGRGAAPDALAARLLWSLVDRVVVHTEQERTDFARAFGVDPVRVTVSRHGATFRRRTRFDREAARRSLGIPPDATAFLSIGFIQPHKGFDRAVRAFAGLGSGARLDIVGSVRVGEPAYVAHLDELEQLVERTPGARLHKGFISDELFDRWIVAADVLVLPYREIWSSGVFERAALYGRPVIATQVGGLVQQAGGRAGVTLVLDDAELRAAMWEAVGRTATVDRTPWPEDASDLRVAVQAEVTRRAAAQRGPALVGLDGPDPDALNPEVAGRAEFSGASTALRRLAPAAAPPVPVSWRPRLTVKRAIRRATAWEVDPVAHQVNALRAATIDAVERLAGAIVQPEREPRSCPDEADREGPGSDCGPPATRRP